MNRKPLYVTFIALFALLLSVSGATAQDPAPQGRTGPQSSVSIAAPLNSRISYQGVLTENGSPVDGSRDITFRLYSDDACITLLESHVKSGVTVSDGLFSVELDVGQGYFDGQGLWLEVEVEGTGIGCREILPVPYALSLRPGATVSGEKVGWDTLHVHNTATTGLSYGLYGQTDSSSNNAKGVYGLANAGSGETSGVYGQTNSSSNDAKGVHGHALASSGQVYGVYGETDSSTNYTAGVYGTASASSGSTYGVSGTSYSSSGRGVSGVAFAASGETAGVFGLGHSTAGRGVFGHAFASSGTTYGVFGQTESPDGRGVHGLANSDSGGIGVEAECSLGSAMYAHTGDGNGVYAITDNVGNNYGFYTPDNVYSLNYHLMGAVMQVVQNGGHETLEPGDVAVFDGMATPLEAGGPPMIQVARAASANSSAVAGVVYDDWRPGAQRQPGSGAPGLCSARRVPAVGRPGTRPGESQRPGRFRPTR
jgi:hypothetical protein